MAGSTGKDGNRRGGGGVEYAWFGVRIQWLANYRLNIKNNDGM